MLIGGHLQKFAFINVLALLLLLLSKDGFGEDKSELSWILN